MFVCVGMFPLASVRLHWPDAGRSPARGPQDAQAPSIGSEFRPRLRWVIAIHAIESGTTVTGKSRGSPGHHHLGHRTTRRLVRSARSPHQAIGFARPDQAEHPRSPHRRRRSCARAPAALARARPPRNTQS